VFGDTVTRRIGLFVDFYEVLDSIQSVRQAKNFPTPPPKAVSFNFRYPQAHQNPQHTETDRWNHKEVDCDRFAEVIIKESFPVLSSRSSATESIFVYCGFAYGNS
jgi:hypothetical protein